MCKIYNNKHKMKVKRKMMCIKEIKWCKKKKL